MTAIDKRVRSSVRWLLGATLLAATFQPCLAQQPMNRANRPEEAAWEIRVYRVTDLILPRTDYPYRSGVPTVDPSHQTFGPGLGGGFGGGGLGGGGGFGGGGFGGSGGGFFQISDESSAQGFSVPDGGTVLLGGVSGPRSLQYSTDNLIAAIQATVEPASWQDMGGEGVITALGGLLLVKQTPDVHRQVDALLTAIREEGGAVQAVTLEAWWLLLDAAELDRLAPQAGDGDGGAAVVDRQELKQLADSGSGYRGRITCFSDQTVHLVSGRRATAVVSGVPTIGQNAVGYHPVIIVPNIGVLLQVRPTVLPDESAAVVSLETTVTSGAAGEQPIALRTADSPGTPAAGAEHAGVASILPLDRLNLDAHHLATTVRLAVGEPTLVGGLSLIRRDQPAGDANAAPKQLYLVLKLSVARNPGAGHGNLDTIPEH